MSYWKRTSIEDVNGNPLRINPNGVPDYLKKVLTRNYRPVMKKVDEKRG